MEKINSSIRSNKSNKSKQLNQPKKLNVITNKKEEIKWSQNTLKIFLSLGFH